MSTDGWTDASLGQHIVFVRKFDGFDMYVQAGVEGLYCEVESELSTFEGSVGLEDFELTPEGTWTAELRLRAPLGADIEVFKSLYSLRDKVVYFTESIIEDVLKRFLELSVWTRDNEDITAFLKARKAL